MARNWSAVKADMQAAAQATRDAQATPESEGDEYTQVVCTDAAHGPLRVPNWLLALWDQFGWPHDHVLAQMATEERWQP